MITLNLKEIFERYDVFEDRYVIAPEELSLPAEVGDLREPVEVKVRIERDKDGYNVRLSIAGNVQLECSRCLELFDKDLSQEKTKHIEPYPREEHLSLSPEDLEVSFMEEPDVIVLEDMVREEILLSIPMKPLCKPDCMGVSHQAIVFEEEKEAPIDPRFAILKDLLTG
ncbi:YceD family protein [Hydrogenivirga sp.]